MSASDGPPLAAAVARTGSTAVVTLTGELDLATAERLRSRLSRVVLADPPPSLLVLDLSGLQFVDAAGIGVLLSAQRSLAGRGGRTVLRSPSRIARRVVKVLDLEHLLPTEG